MKTKTRFALVFLVVIVVALALTSAAIAQTTNPPTGSEPQPTPPPGVQLSLSQMAVIGVLASFLVMFFRLLLEMAQKRKFVVADWVMILIVYVVSFAVAVWWFPQALPPLPVYSLTDPVSWVPFTLTYLGQLLTALSAYATAAGVIYYFLFQKVKDSLGPVIAPAAYKELPPPAKT